MKEILKVIVGSKAHGTFTDKSDTDTRTIFVAPTEEIVGLGTYKKFTEDKTSDDNHFELAHFIYLTLRCNPTTLEILKAPAQNINEEGQELRDLFPCFLSKKYIHDAFKGFATQQRKKMISPTTNYFRKPKAASHFLRVLWNGTELLETGDFTVKIIDTPVGQQVLDAKLGNLLFEEVLEIGDRLIEKFELAFEKSNLPESANRDRINKYLINVRRNSWDVKC